MDERLTVAAWEIEHATNQLRWFGKSGPWPQTVLQQKYIVQNRSGKAHEEWRDVVTVGEGKKADMSGGD